MRLRHKFNASPIRDDGNHFSSKLEWSYFRILEFQKKAGDVLFFMRQVPFHLPGGVKYVVDFLIFYSDGRVRFVDVKGMETPEFKMKKKMVEAHYTIEAELVKREDVKINANNGLK